MLSKINDSDKHGVYLDILCKENREGVTLFMLGMP